MGIKRKEGLRGTLSSKNHPVNPQHGEIVVGTLNIHDQFAKTKRIVCGRTLFLSDCII